MASFTVRVELHQASYQDYENLHAAMARAGFSRFITSDDQKVYQLPTAEYDRECNVTIAQVLEQARAAANSTGKTNAVLVTEAGRRMWNGLAIAKQAQYQY
jgi:hypothetical protein